MTDAIENAVRALTSGEIVVVPTDTVYGIAALPSLPDAIARIFSVKGRPSEKPIPVLGPDIEALAAVAVLDARARSLADAYWPGGLTLVVARAPEFECDLGGNTPDTVGVRIPNEPTVQEILRRTGPLAVTSANRSGRPPATTVEDARRDLHDDVAVYVGAGRLPGGTPSTVVSLVGEPAVLREGAIPAGEVLRRLGGRTGV